MDNDVLFTEMLLVHGAPPVGLQLWWCDVHNAPPVGYPCCHWRHDVHKWLDDRFGERLQGDGCGVCTIISELIVWIAEQEVT